MARGLNLSDEQQRAFMLKASMKKLSSATVLPKRKRKTPVEEAVDERVFASEKGFLKNSEVTGLFLHARKCMEARARNTTFPPARGCWYS